MIATRANCWKYGWIVDLAIKGFFASLDYASDVEIGQADAGKPMGHSVYRALAQLQYPPAQAF